jgi:hypothetical protein
MYASGQKKDRTLDELDKAIAATQATATKVDKLVKEKEVGASAAQTRKTKLIAVRNRVCDECATIPCLMPSSGNANGSCGVCGNAVDRVDPPKPSGYGYGYHGHTQIATRIPSARELKRELASHVRTVSHHEYDDYIGRRIAHGASKKEEFKAPTRKEMLAKAEEFVTKTTAELNEVRQLKTDCDQQKRTLQQEQQQLLGRLGGVKRAASDDSCSVCLTAAKTHVLTPCGHKCMCEQCARGYCAGSQCPICRSRVQSVMRVYD